jgi:hypothetical protein
MAASKKEVLMGAITQMVGTVGYDAVIVCTSNPAQEAYWQKRLSATRGQAAREGALILAVHEDWLGDGAGNGLGTLYAYTKARDKAKAEFSIDLDERIRSGWAVGMFHTAGKGTRLAPLPGSENNNKPGVKLPTVVTVDGEDKELTILEAVIRQTNSYAPVRMGRCSVFWGDQVFIPSAGTPASGSHPADILACLGDMPTKEEWVAKGLDKYGLIAVNEQGNAAQVEKVSFDTATELLSGFGSIKRVGPSLGSFSMSAALLFAMLEEFKAEVGAKLAKLDSDPHFWMPFTLPEAAYTSVMKTKGVSEEESKAHYTRMAAFKGKFCKDNKCEAILGCVDAGTECYWWDYGQLKLFQKNTLLVTKDSDEAEALRVFLGTSDRRQGTTGQADMDATSVVLSSRILAGTVRSSVCTNVNCNEANIDGTVLMNVTAKKISGKGCILYNVVDDSNEGLALPDGTVRADVYMPGAAKIVVMSTMDTDGGKAWKVVLEGNDKSFEEVSSHPSPPHAGSNGWPRASWACRRLAPTDVGLVQVYKANASLDISECQKVCCRGRTLRRRGGLGCVSGLRRAHVAGAGHGQEQGPREPQGLISPPPLSLRLWLFLARRSLRFCHKRLLSCK